MIAAWLSAVAKLEAAANIAVDEQMLKRLNKHGGNIEMDKRSPEMMIAEAVKAAKKADAVVAVVGETQGMTGEAACRTDITLPGHQLDLLKALKKTGKPIVVVLMNGRPLALKWEEENMDAILETWFAGSQAGNAIADVLFGDYNPSGKLTMTFPQVVGQVPIYYNHKNTGRPFGGELYDKYKSRYLDVTNEPLYPFGFGLSYTTFEYSIPEISSTQIKAGETMNVAVSVSNTGDYDGEEVVQLYIRDLVGSITRPVKELKGFKKVFIPKGETRKVEFELTTDDLAFYKNDLSYSHEPGDFQLLIGSNSRDVKPILFKVME